MLSLTMFDWALLAVPLALAVVGLRYGAVWVVLSPLPRAVISLALTLLALLATILILARAGFFKTFNALMPVGQGLGSFTLRTLGLVVFVAYLGMFLHGLGRIRERAEAWTRKARMRADVNRGLGLPAGLAAGALVCLCLPVPVAMIANSVTGPEPLPAISQSVLLPRAQRSVAAIVRWAVPAVPDRSRAI